MTEQIDDLSAQIEEVFADDELLARFARPFKPFHRGRDINASYASLAKKLDGKRLTGIMQLSVRDGRKVTHRCLAMSPAKCEAFDHRAEDPDLEVLTDEATWDAISRGKISPMEAFVTGRMRVRGDIRLAHRIAAKLR